MSRDGLGAMGGLDGTGPGGLAKELGSVLGAERRRVATGSGVTRFVVMLAAVCSGLAGAGLGAGSLARKLSQGPGKRRWWPGLAEGRAGESGDRAENAGSILSGRF